MLLLKPTNLPSYKINIYQVANCLQACGAVSQGNIAYRMKHADGNICKKKLTLKIVCVGGGFRGKKREEAEEKGAHLCR